MLIKKSERSCEGECTCRHAAARLNLTSTTELSEGVHQHEWFMEDLSAYLFPLPGQTAHTEIDSSILAEVYQKLSVSPSDVLAAIR